MEHLGNSPVPSYLNICLSPWINEVEPVTQQPCLVQGSLNAFVWSRAGAGSDTCALSPAVPVSPYHSVGFAAVGTAPSLLASWESFQGMSGSEQPWLCWLGGV